MSSRAWVVDLIHAIGEKTALVDHLEEKIGTDKSDKVEQLIAEALTLRRKQMDLLLRNSEHPDPTWWCDFKHAVKSWTHDVEVYEANLNEETRGIMIKSSEILASVTSLFLGMEFETCARCLYDKMLVKQVKDKK